MNTKHFAALALAVAVTSSSVAAEPTRTNTTSAHSKGASKTMGTTVVKAFFTAFGKGDFNGIIDTFHSEATISAVREGKQQGSHYGTYRGKEGAKTFISSLGQMFDTQSFSINNVVGEGDVVFADGVFVHKIKATGKLFASAWALKCTIKDGLIYGYHFYEDSAAFDAATHK